ncbi:MAG TPA: CBS domain-containing protein [Methanoregulaceae archaeon]|nr:CBS domain-containing protein [Methanoregulaceae archaeon]
MKVASDLLVDVPLLKYNEMVTRARQILREDIFREIYIHDGKRKLLGYVDISDVLCITATKSNVTVEGFIKQITPVNENDTLDTVLKTIRQNRTDSVPVTDAQGVLIGGIPVSELFPVLITRHRIHGKVRDFMSGKVITCSSDETVSKIHTLIIDSGFSAFPVLKKKKIIGIVSRRDLLKDGRWRTSIDGTSTTPVMSVMTTPVITISPDEEIQVAADLMIRHDVSRLPVTDGDKIVGILDRHDVMDAIS